MLFSKTSAALGLLFISSGIYAGTDGEISTSPWYLDTGIRYWLGEAKFKENLFDSSGRQLLSRLTYQDITTNTAEGFFRLNHTNGVFFKGYVGGGSNTGGELIDEDFLPATTPYSRTQHEQHHGRLNYLSLDFGYDLLKSERYKISPFIGYHYWLTHYNSFGGKQTATNPLFLTEPYPTTVNGLNDNAVWNSLRLGVNTEIKLLEHLNFVIDAAYIRAYLLDHDFHNLRPDIRGMANDGVGNGVQLDLAFNWQARPNLSMGIGARLWDVKTDGYSHFEETAVEGYPQYTEITQNNYGVIFQSQYRFDDNQHKAFSTDKDGLRDLEPEAWRGYYLGGNLGYGMYPNYVSILPYEDTPAGAASISPQLMRLQSSGFLAGGQVGHNWLKKQLLWGLEFDLNGASIGGANSITYTPYPVLVNTSITQSLNWFGTFRGRVGRFLKDTAMLPYITGGFSFADTHLLYNQRADLMSFDERLFQETYRLRDITVNWVGGAGLEYAVSRHFSYKLEYLYLGLGDLSIDTQDYAINSPFASHILRLGINYHF